jgi:hypothetical protein
MAKSRRMRRVGLAACMRAKRNSCRVSVGKPEGKKPLESVLRRWNGNTKIDLRKIEWGWVRTGFIWLRKETSGGFS